MNEPKVGDTVCVTISYPTGRREERAEVRRKWRGGWVSLQVKFPALTKWSAWLNCKEDWIREGRDGFYMDREI